MNTVLHHPARRPFGGRGSVHEKYFPHLSPPQRKKGAGQSPAAVREGRRPGEGCPPHRRGCRAEPCRCPRRTPPPARGARRIGAGAGQCPAAVRVGRRPGEGCPHRRGACTRQRVRKRLPRLMRARQSFSKSSMVVRKGISGFQPVCAVNFCVSGT